MNPELLEGQNENMEVEKQTRLSEISMTCLAKKKKKIENEFI